MPQASSDKVLYFQRNDNEYFLIEDRQQTGRKLRLPCAGLAIRHIDQHGSNQNVQITANQHYESSLEPADGKFDLKKINANQGYAGDLFSTVPQTAFGTATTPSRNWWDGTESGLETTNIGDIGDAMKFRTS